MKNSLLIATSAAILALAPVAFAPNANATPLDTKGIPAEAQGIVHVDYDQFAKSPLSAALLQQADQKKYEALKTQYGFDPAKDLNAVTIGFIKPAGESDTPAYFGVARGKFSPEKIIAAAKQANASVTTEGGRAIIDNLTLDIPNQPSQKTALGIIDSSTLLFAPDKAGLAKAIAAYDGQAKSYAAPAALDKLRKQTATPLILGYLGSDITPEAREGGAMMPVSIPKADSICFSLAEDGQGQSQNLRARVRSDFADPDDAQQLQGTIQMLMGFAQMGIAKAGAATGPQADQARMVQKLLSSLQVNVDGNTLDIALAYPVADLVKAIQTYSKRFSETAE